MSSELKLKQHEVQEVRPGQNVVEIWFNGQFIGTVTAADGPGVRIISKYPIMINQVSGRPLYGFEANIYTDIKPILSRRKLVDRLCRHKNQEVRRYGLTRECGDVYCADCGKFLREWNAY
jgi:hypothetical protein